MAILICLALKQTQAQEISEKLEALSEEEKEDPVEPDQVEVIAGPVAAEERLVNEEPVVGETPWFRDFSQCRFYQNSFDTVFVCRQSQIYVIPREHTLTNSNLEALVNIYDPHQFQLQGNILRVFPEAGDSDKMYFLDQRTDEDAEKKYNVTLEIDTRQLFIRPVFALPESLKIKWFEFTASRDSFIYFRDPDEFLALLEVDLEAKDYASAVGVLSSKTVKTIDQFPAVARDYNQESSILSMIDSTDQRFKQALISEKWTNQQTTLVLEITDSDVSDSMKIAMELDEDGVTKFHIFERLGNVWVFAADKSEAPKVTVLAGEQIHSIFSAKGTQQQVFGEHVWISSISEEGLDEIKNSVIVAISEVHALVPSYEAVISFYKVPNILSQQASQN